MPVCHSCKKNLEIADNVGRTETCPLCDADLHCCLNCRHYDRSSYNQCREHQAERVLDKDRSNFCDFFSFKETAGAAASGFSGQRKKANPLDALFKKQN
jgi:hypothetical protein